MKVILNKCYGGFSLSPQAIAAARIDDSWSYGNARFNKSLIRLIEKHGSQWASGLYADLHVVSIPDEATDYHIDEYDGMESIIYVVDGKLHWA